MSWIGNTDLSAPTDKARVGLGPIAQAVMVRGYDEVVLLTDFPSTRTSPYLKWLQSQTGTAIRLNSVSLSGPTNFTEIYEAATSAVEKTLQRHKPPVSLTFHLSPGTPAMAAVWIILGKTRFPAELIESSKDHGVRTASIPLDISADFVPSLLAGSDERIEKLSAGLPLEAPEFESIVHRSAPMRRVIAMARRVAPRSIPVLIEGESGTGKELLARAIHRSSQRRDRPFVAVNCGAIPETLIESELFGHERGAFTGAQQTRRGLFESADEGSIFLDEIGELPKAAQVKLLRVLQEGEITRVGAARPVKVNVRLIAATNRTLIQEVAKGCFREDLYYRVAVATLRLPPLRERPGDVSLLIDYLLTRINSDMAQEPGFRQKVLSASAKNLLLNYSWPGNVRELSNTLTRSAVWSTNETITLEDIRESMGEAGQARGEKVLGRSLGPSLDLPSLLGEVASHYLRRALEEANGNKTKAAELVGLPSYQTFTNWMKRYKL